MRVKVGFRLRYGTIKERETLVSFAVGTRETSRYQEQAKGIL